MKELEYLSKQAKYALIAPSPKQAIRAKPETILAIAEAFRALEQRAEAAEAKLAELERQEPVAYTDEEELKVMRQGTYADMFTPHDSYKSDPQWIPLFTRPAPAINLAELVPDELNWKNSGGLTMQEVKSWNSCRAAIMRNIEEAK